MKYCHESRISVAVMNCLARTIGEVFEAAEAPELSAVTCTGKVRMMNTGLRQ